MIDQDEFEYAAKHARQYFENSANLSRRALARIAVGGAAAVAMLGNIRAANAALTNSLNDGNGIRLLAQGSPKPTTDDLKFYHEVGYGYVYTLGGLTGAAPSVDDMKACKKRYADGGVVLHNMRYLVGGAGGNDVNMMLLNLPGADAACERVIDFIRNTGKNGAGFDYTGGRLMVTGVWDSSPEVDIRGGAMERNFDPNNPNVHASDYLGVMDKAPRPAGGINTLYWGREYKYDEVMANFKKYIAGKLGPAAEENNVFLGFHPDDPPVFESMGGVARIMSNYERIKAVFAASGPSIGLQMCCGIWEEGGDKKMGKDLPSVLKEFWQAKRYREVAFRNVSSPPVNGVVNFHETFMDNGYYDMYKAMKMLVDIGFQGFVNMEHHPDNDSIPGGAYAYLSYAAGYMKSALQAAQFNAKKTVTR